MKFKHKKIGEINKILWNCNKYIFDVHNNVYNIKFIFTINYNFPEIILGLFCY